MLIAFLRVPIRQVECLRISKGSNAILGLEYSRVSEPRVRSSEHRRASQYGQASTAIATATASATCTASPF